MVLLLLHYTLDKVVVIFSPEVLARFKIFRHLSRIAAFLDRYWRDFLHVPILSGPSTFWVTCLWPVHPQLVSVPPGIQYMNHYCVIRVRRR